MIKEDRQVVLLVMGVKEISLVEDVDTKPALKVFPWVDAKQLAYAKIKPREISQANCQWPYVMVAVMVTDDQGLPAWWTPPGNLAWEV